MHFVFKMSERSFIKNKVMSIHTANLYIREVATRELLAFYYKMQQIIMECVLLQNEMKIYYIIIYCTVIT